MRLGHIHVTSRYAVDDEDGEMNAVNLFVSQGAELVTVTGTPEGVVYVLDFTEFDRRMGSE